MRYGLVAIALMNVGVELIKMYFGTSARGVEGRYGRVRAEVASVNHRTSSLERTMPRADALAPEVEETRAETAAARRRRRTFGARERVRFARRRWLRARKFDVLGDECDGERIRSRVGERAREVASAHRGTRVVRRRGGSLGNPSHDGNRGGVR